MGADPSEVPIQSTIRSADGHTIGLLSAKPGASRRMRTAPLHRPDMPLFATLRFKCSTTGKPIDYEVPGDAGTLKDLWSRTLLRHCRHCGQVHRFSFRAAYVAGILAIRSLQPPA